jgi:uncharacterized RDD family membrane protein YckC
MFATWITRVGGYLVDVLVTVPFTVLALVLGGPGTDAATGLPTGPGPLYFVFIVLGIALSGYNRWYLAGKTGQSWGKKAVGISLVDETTGQPIGAGKAFLRDLAHFLDSIICYIGWLFPLWDAKGQTLADKIVKTVVTKA